MACDLARHIKLAAEHEFDQLHQNAILGAEHILEGTDADIGFLDNFGNSGAGIAFSRKNRTQAVKMRRLASALSYRLGIRITLSVLVYMPIIAFGCSGNKWPGWRRFGRIFGDIGYRF